MQHAKLGQVCACEVEDYRNYYCIGGGNVPSLLSLPYFGAAKPDDKIHPHTRQIVFQPFNQNPDLLNLFLINTVDIANHK